MPKTTKRDLLATLAGLPDDAELGGTVTRNGETLWGKSDPTMQENELVQDPKEVLENNSGDSFAATGTAAGTGTPAAESKPGDNSEAQPNNSGQENLGTEQGSGAIQTQQDGSALPTKPQPDAGKDQTKNQTKDQKSDPFAGLNKA